MQSSVQWRRGWFHAVNHTPHQMYIEIGENISLRPW
ncbi:hypothetical protein R8510_03249 [Ralstonia chuxiongensis]|nr:hypothetical protein R8510_03249 [Ralstonia chuxiongensis]